MLVVCLMTMFAASSRLAAQETATQPAPVEEVSLRLSGTIADRPIVIGYARNTSPMRVMDYVKNLAERLKIGTTIQDQLSSERQSERIKQMAPEVEEPLYGVAVYMVAGLIPSFESVAFQQVVDEADARRLVDGRRAQWGENGTLVDLGDGCFKVEYRAVSSFQLPPGADEREYLNNNANTRRGVQFTQRVVKNNGGKRVEQSQVITTLLRLHDSLLYEANFEELFAMQLPGVDAIASGLNLSADLGFNAYLDRIPLGMRQLGWNMLAGAAGSQMQQWDDESESSYAMRKSAGDLGLSVVKAVLFDIDNSHGWARFANVDDDSLRGDLRIRARNNSQLSQQLLNAIGDSRFAPILNDNAAATLHVCVRLPEGAPETLQATGIWLKEISKRDFSDDPKMIRAGETVAAILGGIAEHRNLELLLKVGWTESSGGVFYGGLQLDETPDLLAGLHHMITHNGHTISGIEQLITLEDRDGIQVILMRLPNEGITEIKAVTGANITHVYLAHQNSCFWFAAGSENAFEIIRQSLTRMEETSLLARTPLVSGRIDMERWLSYPQDDPAGIAQMPHWLDENAWWFPPSPFGADIVRQSAGKPNPIMQRVFDLGGSQQAGFSLAADESGLLLQASLGEALANQMVARMIDFQDSMMGEMRRQSEEAMKQMEALKARENAQPPAP